jgi:hypothetical protein
MGRMACENQSARTEDVEALANWVLWIMFKKQSFGRTKLDLHKLTCRLDNIVTMLSNEYVQ